MRLLALHGLRLKGIAQPDAVAAMMGVDAAEMAAELEQLADSDLVSFRYGRMAGYQLTAEGRALGQRLLAEELTATGTRPAIESAYADFLDLNGELLAVCTAWQLREVGGVSEVNDHSDEDYDAGVRNRLSALHERAEPVLGALGNALARFGGHRTRLRTALEKVLAGDHDHLTKPMFPSYHSTWFELHEDLLATLGTERKTERDAAGAVPTDEGTT